MKTILQLLAGVAICFGLAWWLRIDPGQEYGWWMGIVHGLLLVPNWLISLVDNTWLVKAPLHTTMYNIDWWVCGILNIIYWLWAVVGAVISVSRR